MSSLKAAVYWAPPIPFQKADGSGPGGVWSPISCTLIYSDTEAVLVDTPITTEQTEQLIEWIGRTAPGRTVSYIYITHGHGDHWFGIPVLLKKYPKAKPIATPGTISHIKDTISPKILDTVWEPRFPKQIPKPFVVPDALGHDGVFYLQDKWAMHAIECGHSDTYNSTVLWVPDLKLAACGDVVYGGCHQMLRAANTREKREEWIRAVETVEALNPTYVVPGHKVEGEIDGVWHLANTKKYIKEVGKIMATDPQTPQEIFDRINERYPDRFNLAIIDFTAQGAFNASREERI